MATPTVPQQIVSTGSDPALTVYGNNLQTGALVSSGNITYNITQVDEKITNTSITNNFNNTAGGTSGQVQFNLNSQLGGHSGLTYNYNNSTLTAQGGVIAGNIAAGGNISAAGNITGSRVSATTINSDTLNYANGTPWVFTAVTGNITFNNQSVRGKGNVILQPYTESSSGVDFYLSGSNDVHMAANVAGDMLFLGDDNQYVRLNTAGGVDIQSYDSGEDFTYAWNFASNGDLTMPHGQIDFNAPYARFKYNSNDSGAGVQLGSPDDQNYVNVDANGVSIQTLADTDNNIWTFGTDATMKFPGDTIDVGAETSIDVKSGSYSELWWHNYGSAQLGSGADTFIFAESRYAGIQVNIANGPSYEWGFNRDGVLSVPSTIFAQTTSRDYFYVAAITVSGAGFNLQVSVSLDNNGTPTLTHINDAGQGYQVNDVIKINGSDIGGYAVFNDIQFTVTAVGTGGSIANVGSLTVVAGYNRIYGGLKFSESSGISGTDDTGNVTIQTYDSEGPSSKTFTFDNQGQIHVPNAITNNDDISLYTQGGAGVGVFLHDASDVEISTAGGDYAWTFDDTGNLTTSGEVHITSNNGHGGTGYAGLMTLQNTTGGATHPSKFVRLNNTGNLEIVNSAYTQTIFSLSDSGNITASNQVIAPTVKTPPVLVAGLPDADVAGAGARAFVTDAEGEPADGGFVFGSRVLTEGSHACPVYSDGTNWRLG